METVKEREIFILKTTIDLINENAGIKKVLIDEIAASCRFSKKSIYKIFPNKRNLIKRAFSSSCLNLESIIYSMGKSQKLDYYDFELIIDEMILLMTNFYLYFDFEDIRESEIVNGKIANISLSTSQLFFEKSGSNSSRLLIVFFTNVLNSLRTNSLKNNDQFILGSTYPQMIYQYYHL